jgi:hypothetical protein
VVTTSLMARLSAAAERRNLARAGTLKNRLRTEMVVPRRRAHPSTPCVWPPLTTTRVPSASRSAVSSTSRDTEAMEGSASPRNPSVRILARSAGSLILLVACRSSESRASSRPIPQPSSATRISVLPPLRRAISMRPAPASTAFSTSSLTTDAGRSTTSPAAIWLASLSGRTWILRGIGFSSLRFG